MLYNWLINIIGLQECVPIQSRFSYILVFSLVFISHIVLFPFLLFNPMNVGINEKATDEAYM